MAAPNQFKPADFGGETADIQNMSGNSLYKTATLTWCAPRAWEKKGSKAPVSGEDGPCLYTLIRNHGNASTRDRICYVGISINPQTRFNVHPTAQKLLNMRGTLTMSIAPVDFIRGKNRIRNTGRALEEIEHLLIWILWSEWLENVRKNYTLPGMGTNPGNAWHITNDGYRFGGQMPREIIYPWMLVRPGRDRTAKRTVTEPAVEETEVG